MRLRLTLLLIVLSIITLILLGTNVVLDDNFWQATRFTLVIVEIAIVILGIRRISQMA